MEKTFTEEEIPEEKAVVQAKKLITKLLLQ